MNMLFIVLLILALAVLLLFVVALKIIFTFNSDKSNMNLVLLWLYPFLKVEINSEDTTLVLAVYLFNKRIMDKPLKAGKRKTNRTELVRNLKPRDVNVRASYGFRDPSITGVTCGVLNAASQFINIDSLDLDPDFVTDSDYIYVNATAKLNIGSAIINMYRARMAGSRG